MCGTYLRGSIVKRTRKARLCFGCERLIPKGSMAYVWVGVDHGELSTGYDCLDCHEFMLTPAGRAEAEPDGCFWPGSFVEQEYARWPILESRP